MAEYLRYVKPAFENYINPSKREADIVIPHGSDNVVAVDLIVNHIKDLLQEKNIMNNTTNVVSDVLFSPSPHKEQFHTIIN